ncbi:MAG: bacterial Ig-like domain-containing protein, partial [Methanomassiliicoccaceae archaeon]|nr:bacterial Ig-like domain-containing protein [Methanomassiliicoccaceae archaeon]
MILSDRSKLLMAAVSAVVLLSIGGYVIDNGSQTADAAVDTNYPGSQQVLMVSATVKDTPPTIRLEWPSKSPMAPYTEYSIWRKEKNDNYWPSTTYATVSGNATFFEDTNVEVGKLYEYRIASYGFNPIDGGYVISGIKVPAVESRGKVVLLVEAEQASALAVELETLKQDLIGDGWTVLRHDVSNTATPVAARAVVVNEYNNDPANVKAVFLFGHLPVLRAGNFAPDGHANRAWPSDAYYGFMGTITTWNGPQIPGQVQLQVGRVDFHDMPAFSKNATELLRQYLNKDHRYRMGEMKASKDAIVSDGFWGDPLRSTSIPNALRLFPTIWGSGAEVDSGAWKAPMTANSYTWGYFGGGGSYTSTQAVGDTLTTSYISNNPNDFRVIFGQSFGSYFGEWDSQNNLLRAFLATPDYGLTNVWGGRPNWIFHHMAMGETIGYSAMITQNNMIYTPLGDVPRGIHVGLMGDPTLHMFPVKPAKNLLATGVQGGTQLKWTASSETGVTEYYIYGAMNKDGPYTRLAVVQGTSWNDPGVSPYYMVRASKLTTTGSGSYYNLSQGVTAERSLPPVILNSISVTSQPTKNTYNVGGTLDLAGTVVTAHFSDGSSFAVTAYSTSPANGSILGTAGTVNVTVTYETKTTTFAVTVNPEGVMTNAVVSPSSAVFDKNTKMPDHKDISVTLSSGSYSFSQLTNSKKVALKTGVDYTFSGSTITIKKEYLEAQPVGDVQLSIKMTGGSDPTLVITVKKTPVPNVIEGTGGAWKIDPQGGEFVRLLHGENVIDPSNYSVEGSNIKLTEDFRNTLLPGVNVF